jgi:hypothetical protein
MNFAISTLFQEFREFRRFSENSGKPDPSPSGHSPGLFELSPDFPNFLDDLRELFPDFREFFEKHPPPEKICLTLGHIDEWSGID